MTDVFQRPTPVYDRRNLMFEHHFGGCCSNKKMYERAQVGPHGKEGRFPVPADEVEDYSDWAYGQMPHNLTARPVFQLQLCSDCGPKGYYDISRDMFGKADGQVKIDFPCMYGCYVSGCIKADVLFQNESGTSRVEGEMFHSMCFGSCTSEITVAWKHPGNPQMTWKWLGPWDQCKYNFCAQTWVGWRGRHDGEPENVYTYDQSYILSQCDLCRLQCAHCARCQNNCCQTYDYAPRFTRSQDIRRLINGRYDWQMSRRDFSTYDEDLVKESLKEGTALVHYPLPNAQDVCALYTARLYHDVKCTIPWLRWGNTAGAAPETLAAVDVSYRGSANHLQPTEQEHLIVLAGLIINAVWSFPSTVQSGDSGKGCGTGFARNLGPVDNVMRGRIMRRTENDPEQ